MAGGGAGYGTNTTGEGPVSPYGTPGLTPAAQEDVGAYSSQQSPEQVGADVYASLAQPTTDTLNQAYQQALGRTPDTAGANYWSNIAQQQGLNSQQLASLINQSAAAERGTTGYQSQFDPTSYNAQNRLGNAPSYYNTNPYSVDYASIFNPRAGQVAFAQPTMTPTQQAQYLSNWQNDYNSRVNAGITGARQQRVANAQKAQEDYNTKRAQAEAQAAASNKEAIDKAVQEALAQQQQQQQSYGSNNDGYGFYTGAAGGIASLAKGFKK